MWGPVVNTAGLNVLLVDDHELVRAGVKMMVSALERVDAVFETGSGEACVELVQRHDIDIVFMDIRLPSGIDGVTAALRLLQIVPEIKIVMLTALVGGAFPRVLLNAGVKGYLTKSSPGSEIARAIDVVSDGGIYLSTQMAHQLALSTFSEQVESPFDLLSLRELQVILLTVQGDKVQTVGDKLFLSAKTISTYKRRAMDKLGVDNPVDLIKLAMNYGLIEGDQ